MEKLYCYLLCIVHLREIRTNCYSSRICRNVICKSGVKNMQQIQSLPQVNKPMYYALRFVS